jgi:colicin import membrane protein
MLPGTQQRKKKNSTKVNLVISFIFHGVLVIAVLYFAAREGYLGKTMSTLTVVLEQKAKPPEKPKPVEPPKAAPPKVEEAKTPVIAHPVEPPKEVPAAASTAPAAVAPPAADAPTLDFDGGRKVISSTDPLQLYKDMLQNALQLNWVRPPDTDDHTNVALVEIAVDKKGNISNPVFQQVSGQKQWDESVRRAIADTPRVSMAPPSNFPSRVQVQFDVQKLQDIGQ